MKSKNLQQISNILDNLNWLEECIILDVRWLQYGYAFEIDFNIIWDESKHLRHDINEIKLVTLRMLGVQRILFNHSFNDGQLEHPEKMNWGINEISRISVKEAANNISSQWHYYEFRIHWEQQRAISIQCLDLEAAY